MASRHRRPARLAAEGPCAPPGLRHRLQSERRRHRLRPFGDRLRSRQAGARGGRKRADRQGRRPCDGRRHHRRAGEAWRVAGVLRGARRGRRVPPAGRGEPAHRRRPCGRRRDAGPARRAGKGRTVRRRACRAGLRAAAAPARRCAASSAPTTSAPICVGQRRPHPGDRLSRRGHGARRIPVQEPRRDDPCRRLAVGESLERQPDGAVPHDRRERPPDGGFRFSAQYESPSDRPAVRWIGVDRICAMVAS